MTVLFEANSLVGNKSGVGTFSERLLVSMSEAHRTDYTITAYYFNFLGRKDTSQLPKRPNITYKEVRFLPTKLLSILHKAGLQLPYELFLGFKRYDFAIFPNFVAVPSLLKTVSLIVVHDLSYIDCPEFMVSGNQSYLQRFVPKSIRHSQAIIAVSNFTRNRVKETYGVPDEKLIVLPIPYEPQQVQKEPVRNEIKELAKEKTVLFVGTLEPRKNIDNLIRGFAALPESTRDKYRLVLAGGVGWKTESVANAVNETSDLIKCTLTGYINDTERDTLYKTAEAICLVSHYEGFGMPILEASHYNRPVILSDIPVFQEIAKEGGYYCNAEDPADIARTLETVINSPHPHIVKTHYSWQENIRKLDRMIKKVVQDKQNV